MLEFVREALLEIFLCVFGKGFSNSVLDQIVLLLEGSLTVFSFSFGEQGPELGLCLLLRTQRLLH